MCENRCENGWLPADGELDYVGEVCIPLIIPTEYIPCVCNPLSSVNDDIEVEDEYK